MSKRHESCRLCEQVKDLVRSHIVPEFLYAGLYDDKHRARRLRPADGKKGFIQKGLRERLLCKDCERLLNDRFEKPFLTQWRGGGLRPDRLLPGALHIVHGLDYARTKLFLLSVLWRAAVSSLPEFAGVVLGPHEQIMQRMLLDEDAGDERTYPIVGQFAVTEDGSLIPFVSSPISYREFGHSAYLFGIGGCEWIFFVTSHVVAEVSGICLQSRGPTFLGASLLRDLRTAKATRRVQ